MLSRTSQWTQDFTFKCGDTVQPILAVLPAAGLVPSFPGAVHTDRHQDWLGFPVLSNNFFIGPTQQDFSGVAVEN